MSDELVAPVATETTDHAEPAVAEQKPTEGAPPEAKPEKSAEQKELEYLRRKSTKADRNNARLYQEREEFKTRLEQLERSRPAEERQKVEVDPSEIQTYVRTQAQQIARAERIADKCNAIVRDGNAKYPDFTETVSKVGSELPLFGKDQQPTEALEEILDADNPGELLLYLGKNPDIASDLAELTRPQLARRLVKIEAEMKQPPRPSAAPKPHEPERSSSSSSMPDPEKNLAGWMKWRNEQEAAKRKR